MIAAAPQPKQRKTTLQKRNEELRLELSNTLLERRLSTIKALAGRYDAVETNKHRRQPQVETKSEDQTLDPRKRLLAHNVGRDLERNFSPARGIIHQFRINVVGADGKIQVNTPDGENAAKWFNEQWAKDCDFRDDVHWSTQLQNIIASSIREGDILAVFDDGMTDEDTGKLILFEADQIASLAEAEFKKLPGYQNNWTQDSGVVRDGMGRILGYIATGKRGMSIIDKVDNCTFYPREYARLFKNPWRVNQGRGVPSLLTSATNIQDLYEILSKELQSAKVAAGLFGWVKREDAVTDFAEPTTGAAFLPENAGKDAETTALESANGTDPAAPNYERLESLTGGYLEYMAPGDTAEFPDINRPNIHLKEFLDGVMGMAGASVGLARAYVLLRADSSYTSFRGDMVLSWATFYAMQKLLERQLADWVAINAIRWAIRKGLVKIASGWERAISWTWPTMPNVDELKEENAKKQALKNGTTDFSQLLGPDWKKRLAGLAEQVNEIKRLGLPLSILETIGGQAVSSDEQEKPDNEQN